MKNGDRWPLNKTQIINKYQRKFRTFISAIDFKSNQAVVKSQKKYTKMSQLLLVLRKKNYIVVIISFKEKKNYIPLILQNKNKKLY